jgi:polyhydroxybutyrate depolymerase
MRSIGRLVLALPALCLVTAVSCSAGSAATDLPGDLPTDVPADVPGDLAPDVPPDVPVTPDLPPEATADVPLDVPADVAPDAPEPVLPEFLGGDRPAALYVPDDYVASRPWPLIVLLHGYSASGLTEAAYLGLPERRTSKGFVLLTPDGMVDSEGYQFWNAFDSCCNFDNLNVDDVGYLRKLIAEAASVLNIDPGRVYLLGHSNGGFMSFRMACDASDLIVGIASMAGSISTKAGDAECTPAKPVSVLVIHGTVDDSIAYGGETGNRPYLGAEALLQWWKNTDECTQGPTTGASLDVVDDLAGAETTTTGFSGCSAGARVDLWTMQGGGHIPVLTEAFKDAVLDHLLSMRRTAP